MTIIRWILALSLALLSFLPALAQHSRKWEDPGVFEEGQEPAHATLMPFATRGQALRLPRKESPYCLLLNGPWRFHWAAVPEEAPGNFYGQNYNDSGWDTIHVPGNWQMQGYDWPKFRNIAHPFKSNPPFPPSEFNPVGSYRRTFEVPAHWQGRQVFLHFEGVKSASEVWVNGRPVGYNQGAMEPAEYNITPFLVPGPNSLAVRVFRNSDGTYLEDQDMWRLSGIYRDVYLMATPELHIRDFAVTTDLDGNYRDAELRVEMAVRNYGSRNRGGQVRVGLAWNGELKFAGSGHPVSLPAGNETAILHRQPVPSPRLWSAEKPNLYTLVLELLDEQGQVLEVLSHRIGFREVEIRSQEVLVNGVPTKFNGVNSHIHHPDTGNFADTETLRRDLVLMKRFNINLVRTSHYPPPPEYLELADELGMYVIDEVGDEAHATEFISEDPKWREAYLDRARKMVLRDRNHPSIVIWSAGNESGSGDNICAVIEEGKRLDPTRPAWMYGGNNDYLGDDPRAFNPTRCEDIVGPRYPTPRTLEDVVAKVPEDQDPRPSFMDEYISVSGNGLGGLDEFWDLIRRYPRLTGGAIWDWMSPGITWPVRLSPNLGATGIGAPDAAAKSAGQTGAALLGKARLVVGRFGNAVHLAGHDEWVELYRDRHLDQPRDALTLDLWIYPYLWNGHGWYLNKGEAGWGLIQKDEGTLEFYVAGDPAARVQAPVPEGWELRWHRLSGVFDGRELKLYVNGVPAASRPYSGLTGYSTFPVNLGRKADVVGQEHDGYTSHAALDAVRIWSRALSADELAKSDPSPTESLAWLDFETETAAGSFFSLGIGARSYGLAWPDRQPQPELWQLKKSPQPVGIEAVDAASGRIRITNRHQFTDLSELEAVWELQGDGKVLDSGNLAVSLAPGRSTEARVPFRRPDPAPGVEYRLLVSFRLAQATAWSEAGHEVAWEQLDLPFRVPRHEASTRALALVEDQGRIVARGEGFSYAFDRDAGRLVSMTVRGREILKTGPEFNVWRAPVANDFDPTWGEPKMAKEWLAIGLDQLSIRTTRVDVELPQGLVRVQSTAQVPLSDFGFDLVHEYRFRDDGSVEILQQATPRGTPPKWLPKLGIRLEASPGLDRMQWYGRGPIETYADRKTGAKIGVWSADVDELFAPYLIPQDYGNLTDVRWIKLVDGDGIGLMASADRLIQASARSFDTDNLTRAEYPFQLSRATGIWLDLDQAATGVGCTAIKTLEPYRVKPEPMTFRVILRPVR